MIRLLLSHAGRATGIGLLVSAAMVSESPTVRAQADAAPSDSLLVIPGPDGALVPLRSGPGLDRPVVAGLGGYEVVTSLGPAHQDGVTRWLPVKTAANQIGWVEEAYVAVVGAAPRAVAPTSPEAVVAEAPAPPPAPAEVPRAPAVAASAVLMEAPVPPPAPAPVAAPITTSTSASTSTAAYASAPTTPVASAPQQPGKPVQIETKLKYPEAKGRHQEITIWVTRDGVPISGAIVTIFTEDDEDEPMRVLEPTNADGRTRREFAIGKVKGSIELVVSAVAPDGGSGRTTASYFRR
jgi:hypothetical protein